MADKVVHWEVMGEDSEGLSAFYGDVFGWSFTAAKGVEGYNLVNAEQAGVSGAVGQGPDEMPQYLTIYLAVDDIHQRLDEIVDAGGKVMIPRTVIPDVVTFAMFEDPAGNVLGLLEP